MSDVNSYCFAFCQKQYNDFNTCICMAYIHSVENSLRIICFKVLVLMFSCHIVFVSKTANCGSSLLFCSSPSEISPFLQVYTYSDVVSYTESVILT